MDFTIIIINYKQKDYTHKCVTSLKENLKCDHEIIVVNNSPEADEISAEGITVIKNSNKGFSQANNLAAKEAKGKYILFLNADTVLEKDFAKEFLKEFEGREFGAAGLGLVYPGGRYQLSYWHENTFKNETKNKKLEEAFKKNDLNITEGYSKNNAIREVDWVSGAAMIVRKDIFDKLNGFDEDYFLFYEDADFCKRLKDRGYGIYYYPFNGLVHYKGENVNESFNSNTYYYSKESQLLYYKKHNRITDRVMLRIYLIMKFSYLLLRERNEINMKILKLLLGVVR